MSWILFGLIQSEQLQIVETNYSQRDEFTLKLSFVGFWTMIEN